MITSKARRVRNYVNNHTMLILVFVMFIVSAIILTVVQESDKRRQDGEDKLLNSLNKTVQKINNKIVENQKIIIHLANDSLANQHYIIAHFDNVTNDLKRLINIGTNNTQFILGLTDLSNANIANNLNLTKFNRAALLDSNIMIHKLWENLTGVNPCYDNAFANCVSPEIKNITQLITNSTTSINTPKPSAPPNE